VKARPVSPADLIGSMYALLGIDPDTTLPHPQGLTIRVAPPPLEGIRTDGLLKEIMG
jgi:hypothetical protein